MSDETAGGSSHLLVTECVFASASLTGLDEPVEVCAVDRVDLPSEGPPKWPGMWESCHPTAPATRDVPEEGGFLLRPLRGVDVSWTADGSRRLAVPPRTVHTEGDTPNFVSNELFIELRYSMAPSLIVNFDFDDLRHGLFRAFALPQYDGVTMRLLLVLDEAAVQQALDSVPPERLPSGADLYACRAWQRSVRIEAFLSAAAGSPPSQQWSSTLDDRARTAGPGEAADGEAATAGPGEAATSEAALFEHQRRSVEWMAAVEWGDDASHAVRVEPIEFAARTFGSPYEVRLPLGGVLAHPPGAGKSRVVGALLAREAAADAETLLLCPAHLLAHWEQELLRCGVACRVDSWEEGGEGNEGDADGDGGSSGEGGVCLVGYGHGGEAEGAAWSRGVAAWGAARARARRARRVVRLIVDEPQDVAAAAREKLHELAEACSRVWLVCGTASAHVPLLASLLLGRAQWRRATTLDEWQRRASLSHVLRRRFLRDPAWNCLPLPPLQVSDVAVVPSQDEALAAQVSALGGYVVDTVLLLSFGERAAHLAGRERRLAARRSRGAASPRSGRSSTRRATREAAESDAEIRAEAAAAAFAAFEELGPPPEEEEEGGEDAVAGAVAAGAEVTGEPEEVAPAAANDGLAAARGDEEEESSGDSSSDGDGDGDEGGGDEELAAEEFGVCGRPLSKWASVEARGRARLQRVNRRLRRAAAELARQHGAFDLTGDGVAHQSDGVLSRLAFLASVAAVELAVSVGGGDEEGSDDIELEASWQSIASDALAAAEWNGNLAGGPPIIGEVRPMPPAGEVEEQQGGRDATPLLLLAAEPEDGDYCKLAWRAAALGAAALVVSAAAEVSRPMSFGAEQTAPPIPACMVPRSAGAQLGVAAARGGARLRLRVVDVTMDDFEEGFMADVVATAEAAEDDLITKVQALREEQQQILQALRFATWVQRQLHAPRPLTDGGAADGTDGVGGVGGEGGAGEDSAAAGEGAGGFGVCPVCLEECAAVCVMPSCFHHLCRGCLHRLCGGGSSASFRCPLCRVEVDAWQVSVFSTGTDRERAAAALPPPGIGLAPGVWRSLTSKLQRMLLLVSDILRLPHAAAEEAEAGEPPRLLIYTQWLAHVRHISQLLRRAGVPALALSGDLAHCMDCLTRFGKPSEPQVLVLSSQHHSSGINLQCATNLLIVHPYCTPTATNPTDISYSQLVSFEAQAVGRIRRYPQKGTVRVHRLYACGTIEESLYANAAHQAGTTV